jgi:hypothetical protein
MFFHPLSTDLSDMKDTDLEEKIQEITKKYYIAVRLGNIDLLTQLSTFLTIYKEEMSKRNREKFNNNGNGDLDQLINVN